MAKTLRRMTFLAAGASALAGVMALGVADIARPQAAQAAAGKVNIKVGHCTGLENWEDSRAAGFDFLEISTRKYAQMSPEEFKDFRKQIRTARARIIASNLFLPGEIKVVGPEIDEQKQTEYLKTAFSRAKQLGIKLIVFGSSGSRSVPEGYDRVKAFVEAVDFGRRAADLARKHGVTIAVENLNKKEANFLTSVSEVYDYVRTVDRPNFRVAADYYHMAKVDEDPDVILQVGSKYLAHVEIANPAGRAYPAEAGEAEYEKLFANLARIGFRGTLSVEGSTKDARNDGEKAVRLMRELAAQANGPGKQAKAE